MTILLTGGTGDTGSHIAKILHGRGIPFLVASRRGQSGVSQPYTGVQFDWDDATTFHNPFETDLAKETPITAVYLICQIGNYNILEKIRPFIDLAFKEKGVKRFVLLSSSQITRDGPYYGEVHRYFDEIGVEYAVLRPSWFFKNFLGPNPRNPKVTGGEIVSAAGTGKIGFISEADIADAAVEKLTAPSPFTSGDHIIVGPDLLSYGDVAELYTTILGRQIKHKSISLEELIEIFTKAALPEPLAKGLATMDVAIANGAEEAVYNADNRIVGKRHLKDFILENKEKWA